MIWNAKNKKYFIRPVLGSFFLTLIGLICLASPAQAQVPGTFDWASLGVADEAVIPLGTTYESGGITTTVNWSTVTDGGSFVPSFGDDFVSYESGTTGTISESVQLGFDNDSNDPDDKIIVDFSFSQAVNNVQFTVMDIDQRSFDDILEVYYDTGSGLINARTGSFATLGADVVEDDETFADGWEGTTDIANDSATGNIDFNFGTEDIIALRVIYFTGDDGTDPDPTAQLMNISDITYESNVPATDLSLSKTVDNQFPMFSETVTYSISVTNNGPLDVTGVQVQDILPSGLSYQSDDGGTAYNSATGIWTIPGTLTTGSTVTLQIDATVLSSGSYLNLAEVFAADLPDLDSTPNNSGTAPSEDDTDTVSISPTSGTPNCPVDMTALLQSGSASSVFSATGTSNSARSLGPIAAAGTSSPDASSSELTTSSSELVLDLGDQVPENSLLTFSLARDNGGPGRTARLEILFSVDGSNGSFVSAGVYAQSPADYVSTVQNALEHFPVANPVVGAQFVKFDSLDSDDGFVDGIEYSLVCGTPPSVELTAVKTISVVATDGVDEATCAAAPLPPTNDQFTLPGACVEYTISVTHPGGTDATNIQLMDTLPDDLTFSGMSQAGFTSGTMRTTDTAAIPNTITCTSITTDCTVRLEGGSLASGATGTVKIRALIE